ncbi:unnamed protein product, partial [Closterium sp. NIES-54]
MDCGENAYCEKEQELAVCHCNWGYAMTDTGCVDTCILKACSAHGHCVKDALGEASCVCDVGYTLQIDGRTCKASLHLCILSAFPSVSFSGSTLCPILDDTPAPLLPTPPPLLPFPPPLLPQIIALLLGGFRIRRIVGKKQMALHTAHANPATHGSMAIAL